MSGVRPEEATVSSTTAAAPRTYASLRAAWIPLPALCLALFVEMVDNTLLSIALPTIGRDLSGSTTALQWVTGAYSLRFGGLLLTAGSPARSTYSGGLPKMPPYPTPPSAPGT